MLVTGFLLFHPVSLGYTSLIRSFDSASNNGWASLLTNPPLALPALLL